MKNLFKNLMLVAVAAMAFTACQNDNNEVNEVAKKTVLDFVATIANQDDTRSGFTGTYTEGEDTYYQSGWDGNETFIVCANGSFDANSTVDIEDAEGHFSVEFEGNVPSSIDVYSPASAWNSEFYPTIPAVQTPRANSVDPAAHILKAQAASVESGVVTLQHKVAYGKMTVNTPADFEISKVELSLVGLPNSSWTENQTYSYTINANEVEGNVFWFATEEMQIVKEFTVTAYNAEGNAVAKTVSMEGKEKPLAFNYGKVSTFSVSKLEVPAEPDTVMDSAKYYFNYNNYGGYENWGYVVFEDEYLGTLVLNCTFSEVLYLDICTYSGELNTIGVKFDTEYSYYNTVGGTPYQLCGYWVYNSTMEVNVVDGKYCISLDVQNKNGENLQATYVGDIEGLVYPDLRTQLATPSNVKLSVSGKDITVTWDKVDNAVEYSVECNLEETKVVTETTVTFSLPNYEEAYAFRITALAGESDKYLDSATTDWYDIETEADPRKQLSTPNVTTSISGKTITLTWEKVENAESYLINGDSLEEPISTTELTTTITVPDYNDHSFTVQAVVSDDNESYRSSEEVYVEYSDPRAVLPAPTNVNATIDGRYATIEWDAVEGADYYQLSYNLNGNQTVDVTETSHTIDVGFDVSDLWVYVFAKANEDNPDYKSSESWDGSVVVNTGKDPNGPNADNVATNLYFNGDGDLIFVVDAYETFKVRLNSADRPGNTTIKEGEYVGINSSNVAVGKFSVYQKIKGGYSEGYTSTKTTSTMSVEYVDGQYLIIVNYVGQYGGSGEVGYKGVPNGWDAPVADTTPVIKVDQSSVELKRAGGSVDINVTLKNITDAIVAESDNAQFTTSVNGNVVTISADGNNTGAVINGVVTISAGGVSTTVSVQQVAEDIVLEVNWSYYIDSSSSGVYGHVWNVSGKDLDGYDISAQITMDSRNGYTSSSNFTPGTYSYHAQYADGNFGTGMWFTMRNIELRGSSYSNYDVDGTITVVVEGGRTKVTADIYNYINEYRTTKITTFVGYLN